MINHHPSEELLQAYASGRMNSGAALVLSCHLETCSRCRSEIALLDTLGGTFLLKAEPVGLQEDALQTALARIESDLPQRDAGETATLPRYLKRFAIPKSLDGRNVGARQWVAPGIWFAPVRMDEESLTYLVYADRNTTLPRHTHSEREFTALLSGSYSDDLGTFAAGDFSEAGSTEWHAPSVTGSAECLCLINSDGPMKLQGPVARAIQAFVGRLY